MRYLLILTAFIIIFFATKYALANLSYLKVDSYLQRWQKNKSIEQVALDDALTSVDRMLALHGHFPHYLNVAGKVYEWQAFKHLGDQPLYQRSLSQALDYYQQSTQLRAHWPLTWIFMANIKANLKQFDDDFYYYVNQGMKYGPYTYQVNLQVAKFQLQYGEQLHQLSRSVGSEQIKRALLNKSSRYNLLYYADALHRVEPVCAVAKRHKIESILKHKLCQ